ncbi:tetratricopeptide repeat protein, partial [Thermodesulfobacteriota bacterium]
GKKIKESREKVDIVLDKAPNNIEALFLLASILELEKNLYEAASVYEKIMELDSQQTRAYLGLARVLTRQGKLTEAEKMLKEAVDIDPKDVKLHLALFSYYINKKDYGRAEAEINETISANPENTDLYIILGNFYFSQSKNAKAEAAYLKAVETDPKRIKPYMVIAGFYDVSGDKDNALIMYEKALDIQPEDIRVMNTIARFYLKNRQLDDAEQYIIEILKKRPKYFPTRMLQGELFLLKKDPAEAINLFDQLIQEEPLSDRAHYFRGAANLAKGETNRAKVDFEKAVSINPRLMDAFTNIVLLHAEDGAFDQAIEKCNEQMERVKDNPESLAIIHSLKGGLYLSQRKNSEAETAFKSALKENPNFLIPYYSLARIYLVEKQEEKAIAQYRAILDKDPKQVGPHMLLGTIYDMQRRFDLSEKHYREALNINPDFAPAANNLAYLLVESGKNIDEALELALNAKEKLPGDPSVMDTLGWVYYKKGLYENAISEFEDSLERMPDNAVVHYHLGLAHYKAGDKKRAEEELKKALSLEEDFDGAKETKQLLSEL